MKGVAPGSCVRIGEAPPCGAELVVSLPLREPLDRVLEVRAGVPGSSTRRSPCQDHCRRRTGDSITERRRFAEALGLLSHDEALRRAMGENGRRYVADKLRWGVVLARYAS